MIAPDTIQQVKERTDIVSVIGESVRLTRKGRTYAGLCPFHKEKTPSFHVNPERGFFHCFGCKESGSALDFVMKTEGLTFPEAVRQLAERAGIVVQETHTESESREATAAKREKEELYGVNALAAAFFEKCLRNREEGGHPLARYASGELLKRGLVPESDDATDPVRDALQAFRMGYAPWGWDALAQHLRQNGISPLVGERAGLLVPRSNGPGHYDRFRHRLMFAVVDVQGRVVAFSGRALPDPEEAECQRLSLPVPRPSADAPAKYVNSPESAIYTKGDQLFGLYQARTAIRQASMAILVEGNFDVVALHARGIVNVVAPLGTAFTEAQAKLLKRFTSRATLLFDGDGAGRKAVRASKLPCKQAGIEAIVAVLPEGKDPDEIVRKEGPEALRRIVKSARGMLEYLLDATLADRAFAGATLSEQMARVRAAAKLLSEEDDPNLRSMAKLYADKLSSQLVIGGRSPTDTAELERLMETSMRRPNEETPRRALATPERARSEGRSEQIGHAILGALLDHPFLLDDEEVNGMLDVLSGDHALTIAVMRQAPASEMRLYADEFLAQIPRSIHSFAAGRVSHPLFESEDAAKAELLENARKLKRLILQAENAISADELKRASERGDDGAEEALLRAIQARARQKRGLT